MKTSRIAILASGSGSNAENIITHFKPRKELEFIILCNNPQAYVIERAKKTGTPCYCFSKEEMLNGSLLKRLQEEKIDFIILAGFLWKIPEDIVAAYPRAIVNIHPALLPKHGGKGMYGDKVHQAVVAAGEKESGITIHYIDNHYDEGTTIFQAKCEVLPTDDFHQVATKVHALEYEYYPKVIDSLL